MTANCPRCQTPIGPEEINVAKDVALCRACGGTFALSDLVHGAAVPRGVDVTNPPPGAWYIDDGQEVRIGAGIRARATGTFFVIFSLFWNAVVWWAVLMFEFGIAKPTLTHSGRPLRLPDPPAILLVPFVIIGILAVIGAIFCFFGRVEVSLRADEGRISTGLGRLAWRRRFLLSTVQDVVIRAASWNHNDQTVYQIELKGPDMRFGSGLSAPRREFVAGALRAKLVAP